MIILLKPGQKVSVIVVSIILLVTVRQVSSQNQKAAALDCWVLRFKTDYRDFWSSFYRRN